MKNALIGILVLVVGIGLTTLIVKSKPEAKRDSSISTINSPKVELLAVTPQTHTGSIKTQGTVEPFTQITLTSEVQGRIVKTSSKLQDGAFFNKGDILLEVEKTDYRVEVARAQLSVSQAQEQLASERAQASQAKREWRDLGQPDANALFLRKPQINRAKSQLALAEAELKKAKIKLARTTIRAPFSGRIESYSVSNGQHIGVGSPIAKIYATHKVKIRLPLTDKQLSLITPPNSQQKASDVTITANIAGEQQEWPAKLVQIEANIDQQSRQTYVIAEVSSPFDRAKYANSLSPGMFVDAVISSKPLKNTLLVPSSAIQVEQAVFTVNADSKLQKVPVSVLLNQQDNSIIKAPSNQALSIMTTILPFASDGLSVEVIKNNGLENKENAVNTGSVQ